MGLKGKVRATYQLRSTRKSPEVKHEPERLLGKDEVSEKVAGKGRDFKLLPVVKQYFATIRWRDVRRVTELKGNLQSSSSTAFKIPVVRRRNGDNNKKPRQAAPWGRDLS